MNIIETFSVDHGLVENSISYRKRRDRMTIIAEMLETAKKGSHKTRIMYMANLSFEQLTEYLSLLLDLNLLEKVEPSKRAIYKTTEKGLRYLQSCKEIMELLNEM